ncbi:MAG TPA: septal ring lytic transglycosylase RlpA family protein [Candidatus Kryptonia bacterium]
MKKLTVVTSVLVALSLAGCSAAARFGQPSGQTEVTMSSPSSPSGRALLSIEGIASYYADEFNARKTASGEIFDKNALTAAHREFPFGTVLRVTNLSNGKSVEVTVNDRGPVDKTRIIDLSEGAARALDMIQTGTTKVRLDVLKWGEK